MTEQNDICAQAVGTAIERVKYYIQKIAENPVAGTQTGDVLDDVLHPAVFCGLQNVGRNRVFVA